MAFNIGVALGAAAESGLRTYERLGEEKYREMMREKMRRELDQEKQFETSMANARKVDYTGGEAVSDTVAKGLNFTPEQQVEFNSGLAQLPPETQAEVLRAYSKSENATGGVDLSKIGVYKGADGNYMASNQTTPRKQADIYRDVAAEMQAQGNTSGLMKALGIKTAVRESELQDKFDDWSSGLRSRMTSLQTTITNKGLSGVPAIANPELKKAGITTEFVDGKNGGSLVARQNGQVIGTYTNPDEVLSAVMSLSLNGIAMELLPMLGSPEKVSAFLQGQQQLALKGREVDIKRQELGIKAGNAASEAEYRKGMLQIYQTREDQAKEGTYSPYGEDANGKPVFSNNRQTGFFYSDKTPVSPDTKVRSAQALVSGQASIAPYGEDANGKLVYSNNKAPGLVYGDGTPVPADAKIKSAPAIVAGTRSDGNSLSVRAADTANALVEAGEINPRTGKPFADVQEATAYAYKILLKDPNAKQMTEAQKLAYPKFLDAVEALGPKANDQQIILLAKRFGLPSTVTGLPETTNTGAAITGNRDFEKTVLGGGKNEKPGGQSAIPASTALPPGYTRVAPSNTPSPTQIQRGLEKEDLERRISTMTPAEAKEFQRTTQFLTLPGPLKAEIRRRADPRADSAPRGLYVPK